MKVVADAGPLMAFAKIGGLSTLFRVYPKILTPRAVFDEAVTAGLKLQAPDAALLEAEYKSPRLEIGSLRGGALQVPAQLGRGEEESILLAVEQRAERLLIDDRAARLAAISNLQVAGLPTRVQGTLGVIVSARMEGLISVGEALRLVEAIEKRRDIWIHTRLCQKVIEALRKGS